MNATNVLVHAGDNRLPESEPEKLGFSELQELKAHVDVFEFP